MCETERQASDLDELRSRRHGATRPAADRLDLGMSESSMRWEAVAHGAGVLS